MRDQDRDAPRSAQFEFLLHCARKRADPPAASSSLVPSGLDWEEVLRVADAHAVLPLVAERLETSRPGVVPAEALALARDYQRSNALRNRLFAEELIRILDALEAMGTRAVPYKGPLLAATAYGDVSLRQFTDLDLLIREPDLSRARARLEALGYRRVIPGALSPRQELEHLRWKSEAEFLAADGVLRVDLHWRLAPRRLPFRIDSLDFWSRIQAVPLLDRRVPAFASEDALLALCMHGTKDRWEKLVWIVDVDRLIRSQAEMDWDAVVQRARAGRLERALRLGLLLATDLLETSLPGPVRGGLETEPGLQRLAREIAGRLFAEGRPAAWVEASKIEPVHLACCDRILDRPRYLFWSLLAPDTGDFSLVSLPDPLFPLYRLIRPLRLFARWARLLWLRRAPLRGPKARRGVAASADRTS